MKIPDFFKDSFNPTAEELKKWAYGSYYSPNQDFQLFVMNDPYLILGFITDLNCSLYTRNFFIDSIYTWIGDTVRGSYEYVSKDYMHSFLEYASSLSDTDILKLVSDANYLISNPSTYTYEKWGIGANSKR